MSFKNSRYATYSDTTKSYYSRIAKVVDIGGNPSTIG